MTHEQHGDGHGGAVMSRRSRSRSFTRRLPKPLLDQVHARFDSNDTLDEILASVDAAGVKVSRSALGRYRQRYDAGKQRTTPLPRDAGTPELARLKAPTTEVLASSAAAMKRDAPRPGIWGLLYAAVGFVMALLAAACVYGLVRALGKLL